MSYINICLIKFICFAADRCKMIPIGQTMKITETNEKAKRNFQQKSVTCLHKIIWQIKTTDNISASQSGYSIVKVIISSITYCNLKLKAEWQRIGIFFFFSMFVYFFNNEQDSNLVYNCK